MKAFLKSLEQKIDKYSRGSELTDKDLQLLPENIRQLHSYRLFGSDLLAIPGSLFDDEFERPFRFVGDLETLEIFEREFRPDIPENFIQIGSLYGANEIVLLDKQNDTIHIFHVSDTADASWLKRKLNRQVCDIITLIESLRPQTVCCLMDPGNYSKWDIFEIANGNELKLEGEIRYCADEATAWLEYKSLIRKSLEKGFQLHYAPIAVRDEFGKK
ncbi:hypothetical protein WBG78_23050 [Chryseolinea sp. T2]|uniref:hypothetical protein n=1 Tax=Chryseolinea sp. T2 TaxID=3129255 RepID=UPI003077BCD1